MSALALPSAGLWTFPAEWTPGHGRVDYLLRVDKKVVGVIESNPEGSPARPKMVPTGYVRHVRLQGRLRGDASSH